MKFMLTVLSLSAVVGSVVAGLGPLTTTETVTTTNAPAIIPASSNGESRTVVVERPTTRYINDIRSCDCPRGVRYTPTNTSGAYNTARVVTDMSADSSGAVLADAARGDRLSRSAMNANASSGSSSSSSSNMHTSRITNRSSEEIIRTNTLIRPRSVVIVAGETEPTQIPKIRRVVVDRLQNQNQDQEQY